MQIVSVESLRSIFIFFLKMIFLLPLQDITRLIITMKPKKKPNETYGLAQGQGSPIAVTMHGIDMNRLINASNFYHITFLLLCASYCLLINRPKRCLCLLLFFFFVFR